MSPTPPIPPIPSIPPIPPIPSISPVSSGGPTRRTFLRLAGLTLVSSSAVVAACRSDDPSTGTTGTSGTSETTASAAGSDTTDTTDAASAAGRDLYDSGVVHAISVEVDEADYAAMIETFQTTDDKEWIEASVVIDGERYRQAGMRLKGNSSLAGLGRAPGGAQDADGADNIDDAGGRPAGGGPAGMATVSAEEPEGLPWLIRLDKYIDGQHHGGHTELVVRSNGSQTALNEAVALELLEAAGLASQQATPVRFTVNDRPQRLRLVVEHPNDTWTERVLGDGNLYKADSTGDYSYRGEDPEAYTEAFDQEAGEDDLTPLVEFLDFVNNSDDATFAAELEDRLDVDAFARYLAIEELFGNFDDIDGPGNNSYLYIEPDTGRTTVVAWDHNLAMSAMSGGMMPGGMNGGLPGGPAGGTLPDGGTLPELPDGEMPELPDGVIPGQGGGFGPMGGSNPLVTRCNTLASFIDRTEAAAADLRTQLYDSGMGAEVLARWVEVLTAGATDLVDLDTITTEAATIETFMSGS